MEWGGGVRSHRHQLVRQENSWVGPHSGHPCTFLKTTFFLFSPFLSSQILSLPPSPSTTAITTTITTTPTTTERFKYAVCPPWRYHLKPSSPLPHHSKTTFKYLYRFATVLAPAASSCFHTTLSSLPLVSLCILYERVLSLNVHFWQTVCLLCSFWHSPLLLPIPLLP